MKTYLVTDTEHRPIQRIRAKSLAHLATWLDARIINSCPGWAHMELRPREMINGQVWPAQIYVHQN